MIKMEITRDDRRGESDNGLRIIRVMTVMTYKRCITCVKITNGTGPFKLFNGSGEVNRQRSFDEV